VVVTAKAGGLAAALMLILKLELADWADGLVESVTLTVAVAVPTELCAGMPVIIPVEALMDRPPGRLVAL
jgi:galactitol-specific phosphotransferase system IIC component